MRMDKKQPRLTKSSPDMAATNNSLTLGQKATVPAPEQAPSGTFEKNVPTWSSSAELYRPYDHDAQVSPGLIPHKLMPLKACTANPTPAPTTQLVTTHDSPIRVDHSCVTQRAPMDALPTATSYVRVLLF